MRDLDTSSGHHRKAGPTRRAVGLGAALSLFGALHARSSALPRVIPDGLVVYYGDPTGLALPDRSLLVLDSDVKGPVSIYRGRDQTILGYMSLVEVHSGRSFYPSLVRQGLVGELNKNWPDARFIDIRDERWAAWVTTQLIPGILAKGFDGIFLDTLDSAEFLESKGSYGTIAAAADLIRRIRQAFPSVPIMANRGYGVLPRVPGQFDMLLGESVRATFDNKTRVYRRVSEADCAWQCRHMQLARQRDPKLLLFSLDYWDPKDRTGIEQLYAEERSSGFIPYVATADLTQIIERK